jgi:hypothetical protein
MPDRPDQPPVLDLGRLPIPGPQFVGREAELARLDQAWEDPSTHVLTLVAFGGVGKTALVSNWLDRMAADGWRGAVRVLDWSFYSQGTKDQTTSAEPFLDYALRFCGDANPQAGSPHDRGVRLAYLIRKERTLLLLDGIEPLQYPPGPLAGRLKDPGLAALLKNLAADNPGLCLVTTRERIADLANFQRSAPQISLESLDPDSAVELLRQLGVDGREKDLRAAVEEFGCHALTLTLLGNYLHKAHRGDIRKRKEIDLHRAADLAEGLEIAERGSMRLHKCDAHLENARLCRDQGDLDAARRHVARARELVEETGYKRREREVGWLEKELAREVSRG